MITAEQLIQIGRFNSPHGINGEIAATLSEDVDLTSLQCIVVDIDGIYVPFFIKSIRNKNATTVLLTIEDINDEKESALLANKPIFALRDQCDCCDDYDEDADGFYAEDLIGYKATDTTGKLDGDIIAIDDSTDNVLLIVRNADGKDVMIPAVEEFIDAIDQQTKKINFDLPEGFPGLE